MELIQEAARAATETRRRMLDNAQESAVRAKHRLQLARQHELARRRENLRTQESRMRKAIEGTQALLGLVAASEFAELLELQKQLVLYARKEKFEDSGLFLTPSGIALVVSSYGIQWGNNDSVLGRSNYDSETSVYVVFDIAVTDEFLLAKKLVRLYVPHAPSPIQGLDASDEELGHLEVALRDAMAEEILFQILVDCSDPEKLGNYVTRAIN